MSSLNKRYAIATTITFFIFLILFLLQIFSFKKDMKAKNSVQSKSEISLVNVHKKKPEVKQPVKKVQKKEKEKVIPSKTEEPKEEKPEEVVQQEVPDNAQAGEETSEAAENDGNTADENVILTYKTYALKRISSKKVYPLAARAKNQTGQVKLKAVILADGSLAQAEIVQPSEFEVLNNAALSAVQKAAPFKKMPPLMNRIELVFIMEFSLN